MPNQCGVFYSLYRDYELKILRVNVKLAYLGIYFIGKHASVDLVPHRVGRDERCDAIKTDATRSNMPQDTRV